MPSLTKLGLTLHNSSVENIRRGMRPERYGGKTIMFDVKALLALLETEKAEKEFQLIYGKNEAVLCDQKARYAALLDTYAAQFGCEGAAPVFFSSPGRTEIIGNHTDHNNGLVLAAAVTLDTLAAAVGEDPGTIEDVYEPYLLKIGFLTRTPRGRMVTRAACGHLGYPVPEGL